MSTSYFLKAHSTAKTVNIEVGRIFTDGIAPSDSKLNWIIRFFTIYNGIESTKHDVVHS